MYYVSFYINESLWVLKCWSWNDITKATFKNTVMCGGQSVKQITFKKSIYEPSHLIKNI